MPEFSDRQNEIDLTDDRERLIGELLANDCAVIWRADLPWHQGHEGRDRHIIGFVNSPAGPEIFMASARNAYRAVQGSVHMRAPVADVCRFGAPRGDVKAIVPRGKSAYDDSVIVETTELGEVAYVGRIQTHGSAVYLLRLKQDFDGAERLIIATARDELDWQWPKARVVWGMPFEEVIEMASSLFRVAAHTP